MLLAIDCGNTQTVIGLFSDRELVDHWRIATVAERTSDELALMFQQFLGFHGFSFDAHVSGVAIASGVPRVTAALREMTRALLRVRGARARARRAHRACRSSTTSRRTSAPTASPTRSGAYDLYGGPTIVVDFGTANTVDAVSAKGEYLGGAIFPGHRDLARRAVRPRGRAAAGRAGRAEERDRQVDDRGDPVGRGLRLQRPGRRHRRPLRGGARAVDRGRHRRPRRADHAALPHDPALRALAHPPGPPHRPRTESASAATLERRAPGRVARRARG